MAEKAVQSGVRRKDKQFELAGEADTTDARWPTISRNIYCYRSTPLDYVLLNWMQFQLIPGKKLKQDWALATH